MHIIHDHEHADGAALAVEEAMRGGATKITGQEWLALGQDDVHFEEKANSCPRSELDYASESAEHAFIIHSSGSTGFPKPISLTHTTVVLQSQAFRAGIGLVAVPLCHSYGHVTLWRAIYSALRLFVLPSAMTLTTANLLGAMQTCLEQGGTIFYAVPLILKIVVEAGPKGMVLLKRFDMVMFTGSACPTDVGDALVRAGVRFVSCYGATETGHLMDSMRDFEKNAQWQGLRVVDAFRPFCRFEKQPQMPGETDLDALYEIVVLPGWQLLSKSNRPDGSYATKDLFRRHPTIADAWVYVGRADDTIVHSNGEKTNPVPMELEIVSSPFVRTALVFGAGQSQTGCLVLPSEKAMGASMSPLAMQRAVWPSIEAANKTAPSHSRIVPELVVMLPSSTRFASVDKGSFIRAKVLNAHDKDIAAAYKRYEDGNVEGSGSMGDAGPQKRTTVASIEEALHLVRHVIHSVEAEHPSSKHYRLPNDDEDLFEYGIDSITVTRISSLLRRQLLLPATAHLSSTATFEYPSIASLAKHLFTLSTKKESKTTREQSNDEIYAKMSLTVRQLASQVKPRAIAQHLLESIHTRTRQNGTCVVLTGATGSLGAHLVHQLSLCSEVETIYCLCRARDKNDAEKRVEESLSKRKLPSLATLRAKQHTRVICLEADLAKPDLGLGNQALDNILDIATVVLHNGWPVNFKMTVESFASSLQGTVNLLNLCARFRRTVTPRFLFSSSVSAREQGRGSTIPEEVSFDPRDAFSLGYARSKWIVEALCQELALTARIHGLELVVLRIGQMVGDTQHGIWNETEAYPLMFKTAQTIGALPDKVDQPDQQLNWLPVDVAGWMCARLTVTPLVPPLTPQEPSRCSVVHIVNDQLTPYKDVVAALRKAGIGNFAILPGPAWVRALRTAEDQDPRTNPAIKLLDYFATAYGGASSVEPKGQPTRSTTRLRQLLDADGALSRQLRPLAADLVARFVDAWRESGFLV